MFEKRVRKSLLHLRFEGSAIRNGRILYDDLETFVSNFSSAIERIISGIQTGESIKRGRPLKVVKVLSNLEIVYTDRRCFGIALDLRRNGQQFPGWDLGEQATDILVRGIDCLNKDKTLPKEYDHGVLMALREAGKIIDRGIDTVGINSNSSFGKRRTTYAQPIRDKVITRIRRFEQAYSVVEGRLLSADVREDRLKCRIEPSIGEPIPCTFDELMTEQILRLMRQFVQARGEATYDVATGKMTSLRIMDLESIDKSTTRGDTKIALSSFWKTKTFDELADEQGIYPVDDLSTIMGGWPTEEDVDSFLDTIRGARAN